MECAAHLWRVGSTAPEWSLQQRPLYNYLKQKILPTIYTQVHMTMGGYQVPNGKIHPYIIIHTYNPKLHTYVHIHTRPSWFVRVKFSLSPPLRQKSWVRRWACAKPVGTTLYPASLKTFGGAISKPNWKWDRMSNPTATFYRSLYPIMYGNLTCSVKCRTFGWWWTYKCVQIITEMF